MTTTDLRSCFTVATFPATNSIHRAAVIGVPLFNSFLHVFILSYTKERGNAHSSPTYSLWSLKWESPARNRMNRAMSGQNDKFIIILKNLSINCKPKSIRKPRFFHPRSPSASGADDHAKARPAPPIRQTMLTS
ncbi:hypothetical protein B1694_09055 [Geobacillus zalihae]|nr:hypothetical protein B1694_09055 [Geobacillus zalihae]